MADTALLSLTSVASVDGTENFYHVVGSNADRRATISVIKTYTLANSTGTGSVVVMNTSPTLVTPVLGVAAATTVSVGANGGTGGAITLFGSSTGSCRVFVSSTAGSVTLRLPVTNGGTNSVMVSDGSGNLSFAAATAGGDLVAANNLSDVANSATARTNLGVAYGKQSIWVPARAMTPRTTNGAAIGLVEMTTNKNMVYTLDFDASTQEFAQFDIRMPKSWNEGTITFIPVWSHAATVTNFGVVWGLDAVAISDDDAMDVAFGTAQTSTDTGGTTNDSYQGPESAAITVAGTPAAGDLVQYRIHRDPSDGGDTLAVDARLHGVLLLPTNDNTNDT